MIFSKRSVSMRWSGIVIVAVLAVLVGCKKQQESLLPDVNVYINISLTLPEYEMLNFPGNVFQYRNEGYQDNGVYIVRISQEDFAAYDVTCTDHLDKPTATLLEGAVAKCPECKTEYQLLNYGYSVDESRHLQPYRVEVIGELVIVRNKR